MHTIELLEQGIEIANCLGYGVRHEWLGGCGGGACQVAGRKWIFIDLALGTSEQLDLLVRALREAPEIGSIELPGELSRLLDIRRAA